MLSASAAGSLTGVCCRRKSGHHISRCLTFLRSTCRLGRIDWILSARSFMYPRPASVRYVFIDLAAVPPPCEIGRHCAKSGQKGAKRNSPSSVDGHRLSSLRLALGSKALVCKMASHCLYSSSVVSVLKPLATDGGANAPNKSGSRVLHTNTWIQHQCFRMWSCLGFEPVLWCRQARRAKGLARKASWC